MALQLVIGPPFAGKSQFARARIDEREAAGELGLIAIDFSALFGALVPGVLSSYRDVAVSETGSPRYVGYLFEAAVSAAVARGASGYVLLNSPARAVRMVERVEAKTVIEIDVDIDTVTDRIDDHLTTIRGRVPRARTSAATARCAKAATSYYAELPAASDRLTRRKAKRQGKRWKLAEQTDRGFDEAAFLRGLTPAGHDARADLLAETGEATPAAIFRRVLANKVT